MRHIFFRAIRNEAIVLFLVIILLPATALCSDATTPPPLSIYDVSVAKGIFNPSAGETISIKFSLSEAAKVSLRIFDFDNELIAVLSEDDLLGKGTHSVLWNGYGRDGKIVPDEAYFFTIEAAKGNDKAMYDPTSLSGGITHEIEQIKFLPEEQQLEYYLPAKGRVSIKAGIIEGPLLALPVDWEPRAKGLHRESWDGMDQDGLISVLKNPRYQIRASYFTLPDTTIITTGNKIISYLQDRQMRNAPKTKKNVLPTTRQKSILISPLYTAGILFTKSFPVEIAFPQARMDEFGIPVFKHSIPINVDLQEKLKAFLYPKQYEIYFFLDHEFLSEEPGIKFPYETGLDVRKYTPGIHVLSVNIVGPGGQMAIKSHKVILQ